MVRAAQSSVRASVANPLWFVAGALIVVIGWSLVPDIDEAIDRLRYWVRPIARTQVVDLVRGQDEVQFALVVTRLRRCSYLRPPTAYAQDDAGVLTPINADEVGDGSKPRGRGFPPDGTYRTGTWRLWPLQGAVRVKLVARYSCPHESDDKYATLADIGLKDAPP